MSARRVSVALLWTLAAGPVLAQDGWSAAQQLSQGPRPARILFNWGRAVAVDAAGSVHVAWLRVDGILDPAQPLLVVGQVFHRRSADGGRTWSPAQPLVPGSPALAGPPKLAASGRHVYVVWHAPSEGTLRLQLRHSGDHGASWDAPITVSDNPGSVGSAWPAVAASGDGVHVVWGDARSGNAEIYLRSSPDAGRNWTPVRAVSSHDGISSWTPSVAAQGPLVHVAWTDERHNRDAAGRPFDCASVGAGDSCREEEYYRRSPDFGWTWEEEQRLSHDPAQPHSSWAPAITVSGSDVHVSFFDRRSGIWEIYHVRSRRFGEAGSWEPERPIATAPGGALQFLRPSIAARGAAVDVVFWGQRPDATSDVYWVGSTDAGKHFMVPQRLTLGEGRHALHPSLAVAPDGRLHAVWYDRDAGGIDQIFHSAR